MKILCVGDSTALPGRSNKYEDTWLFKLKKKYQDWDFITFFKRGITTNVLSEMGGGEENYDNPTGADCLEHYLPDKVIIQLGIVDCAPRLIKENKLIWKIIRRLGDKAVNRYIKYLKNFERDDKNVIVSKEKFYENILNYLKRCEKLNIQHVILIEILEPSNEISQKNKKLIDNAKAYNKVIYEIKEKFVFLEVLSPFHSLDTSDFYEDGYHPNPKGNKIISEKLINSIDNKFVN